MTSITELRKTAERAYQRCQKRDRDGVMAALHDLATQALSLFGPSPVFSSTFAVMDQAREAIKAGQYDDAIPQLLALVVKFRAVERKLSLQELGAVIASKMVAEERRKVLFMCREEPEFDGDSGWRLYSGHESQAYASNPENLGVYDVEAMTEIDPDIIPHLMNSAPCAFRRASASEPFSRYEQFGNEAGQ
jgi:hypothetical protein